MGLDLHHPRLWNKGAAAQEGGFLVATDPNILWFNLASWEKNTHNPLLTFHHSSRLDTDLCVLSCVWLFATPWTVAHQAPLSMGFPSKNTRVGLPFPPPGDLPDRGIKPMSLASPALAGGLFTTSAIWYLILNTLLRNVSDVFLTSLTIAPVV